LDSRVKEDFHHQKLKKTIVTSVDGRFNMVSSSVLNYSVSWLPDSFDAHRNCAHYVSTDNTRGTGHSWMGRVGRHLGDRR